MPPAPNPGGSGTADEIRQAALEQFAQSGFDGTSMRDIAGNVGIRAASLYNHFGSKEAMLWDLTLSALTELAAGKDEAMSALPANATPTQRLKAFVSWHVAFHAEHRNQALLVNSQMGSLSPDNYRKAVQLRDTYESTLRAIVADGVDSGEFSVPDLRVTTFAILQMGTAVSSWFRPDGPQTIEQLCDIYVELAVKMLAPRRKARGRAS
jgi:TetR/AcrR family transcriptional regulator, cholesterol catabolism regulator